MKVTTYNDISRDLLHLYCAVRHPDLEALYLKFAQAHYGNFSKWLQKNKQVQESLKQPAVYDAILTLVSLKMKFGEKPSINEIIGVSMESEAVARSLPYIMLFSKLLLSDASDMLSPFQDIILTIGKQLRPGSGKIELDETSVLDDLIYIRNEFSRTNQNGRGPHEDESPIRRPLMTMSAQRKRMFVSLLKRFSDELASACESEGLTDLATALRDGVLAIAPPLGLGKYIELDPISDDQMAESKKMAEYVFNYPSSQFSNYHHDVIEVNLLQKAGGISEEDLYRFKQKFEEQKQILDYFEQKPESESFPGIDTGGTITGNTRLNPDYMYMLAMVFFFLQQKLRIPPVSFGAV